MRESTVIEHRLTTDHQWLLLDQAHTDAPTWRDLPGMGIAPGKLTAYADHLPRLIPLGQLDTMQRTQLLPHLLDQAGKTNLPVAALFSAQTSETHLRHHLGQRLTIFIPRQGEHLFRYYDPRVFRHLLWMCTPEQIAALFGPITAWTWRDARGQWRTSLPPQNIESPPSLFRNLHLDLPRIGILERCLRAVCRTMPALDDDPENVLARRIDGLLDEAVANRLVDEDDLQRYVEHALRHPGIHRHPELQRRLNAACEEDNSYIGACSDLDDTTLAGYAAELGHPRKEFA